MAGTPAPNEPGFGVVAPTENTAPAPQNQGSADYYASLDQMTPAQEKVAGQLANTNSLKQTQAEGLDPQGNQPIQSSALEALGQEFSSPAALLNNEWMGLKAEGHFAAKEGGSLLGEAENVVDPIPGIFHGKTPWDVYSHEDWNWGDARVSAGQSLATDLNLPGIKQVSQTLGWGWQHVVNDVFARAALTVADGVNSNDWSWQDAARFQNSAHLDVGQSLAAAATRPFGVWSTTQDLENLKQNNGAFNIASLAGNIGGAFADPAVLAPKIARWAADASTLTGKIAEVQDATAHTRVIPLPIIGHVLQNGEKATRDIQVAALTSPDAATWASRAADAQAAAKGLGNITTKLRIMQANSLYTRLQQLKVLANVVDEHTFANLSTFRNSVSGTSFAMAMHQALRAGNDQAVNQLVRLGLGDQTALDELRATSADLEDKIRVASGTPSVKTFDVESQAAFDRYDAIKQQALDAGKSEQQAEYEAQMSLYEKPGADFLDPTYAKLMADQRQKAEADLAKYEGYADWIRRVTPSEGDAGELAANSFFSGLSTLGSKMEYAQAARRYTKYEDNKVFDLDGHTPADRGGSIKTFQATPFSVAHRVIDWGKKEWLHRVGAVDLTDLDGMMHVVNHYMDQIETLTGVKSPNARAQVQRDLYNAKTELARSGVLTKLENEGMTLMLKKHGADEESAHALADYFEANKSASVAHLMDGASYGVTKDSSVFKITDDAGNAIDVHMPVSVAQLKNHHILTNLTDFEREVKDRKPALDAWMDWAKNEDRKGNAPGAGWGQPQSWSAHMRHFTNKQMDGFNTLWKPLTLLSTRWPLKMAQDEAVRIALKMGMFRYGKELLDGSLTGAVSGVRTGSANIAHFGKSKYNAFLADEDLQGPKLTEAYDERTFGPQGNSIPADALASLKFSPARQERLEQTVGVRSKKAGDWPDEFNAALKKRGGTVVDPMTFKPVAKDGIAVSVHRGVRESQGAKPTADAVNRFMLRNSNVLADKTARVGVWYDKESGRWVMDVVHHFAKGSEQAAANHAAKFMANEVMDVGAGFKKYFADAPRDQHIPDGSLFPALAPKPEPLSIYDSWHTPARDLPVTTPTSWKGTGRRAVTFKDGSGKTKFTGMFQTPGGEYNYNHYATLLQAGPTWRHILGDTEFKFNELLAGAQQDHYRNVVPTDPNWAKFYAYNINRVIRHDPVSRRLLSGQTYGEVADWLDHSAEGRNLMTRLGTNGTSSLRLARMHGAIVKNLMPAHMDELHSIVAQREITVADVERLFPKDSLDRMEINGDDTLAGVHQGIHGLEKGMFKKAITAMMTTLSTKPHEALARNPFASMIYKQHMRGFFRANPDASEEAINAAAATARAKAVKGVRDYLMNNTDERQLAHVTRYLFPFYGAKLEIMEKYLRLGMQNPENFERMNLLMSKSPYWGGNLWSVQDANGNQIDENSPQAGYSGQNSLVIGKQSLVYRGLVGLLGEKYAQHMVAKIPMNQVDGTFRGENPFAPPIGLPVQFLSQEAFFNSHPATEDHGFLGKLHETLFPYGDPKNQFSQLGAAGQALSDLTPAWIKRTLEASGVIDRMSDPAWNSLVVRNYMDAEYAWETGGRQGPAPTPADAVQQANSQYAVRGVMGAALPFFGTQQSEYQGLLDTYRSLRELPGVSAMSESQINRKFADQLVQQWEAGGEKGAKPTYGSDQFWADYLFVHEASTTGSGINASDDAWNKFIQNKGLIDAATQAAPGDASKAGGLSPIAAILSGSTAAGNNYTYSPGVEAALGRTKILPDSPQTYTTANDPQLEIQKAFIDRAWAQYMDLSQSRDAVLRQRAAVGLSGNINNADNADLKAAYEKQLGNIVSDAGTYGQQFSADLAGRTSQIGTVLAQSYAAVFNQSAMQNQDFATRPDLVGLRTYLATRQEFMDTMKQLGVSKLTFNQKIGNEHYGNEVGQFTGKNGAATIGAIWGNFVQNLIGQNPAFANVFYRYLQSDNLSVAVEPQILQKATNMQGYQFQNWGSLDLKKYGAGQ